MVYFFNNTNAAQFLATSFTDQALRQLWKNLDWAAAWANFYTQHLVTLPPRRGQASNPSEYCDRIVEKSTLR
jgi:hypothetical protein